MRYFAVKQPTSTDGLRLTTTVRLAASAKESAARRPRRPAPPIGRRQNSSCAPMTTRNHDPPFSRSRYLQSIMRSCLVFPLLRLLANEPRKREISTSRAAMPLVSLEQQK
uniref:Uncharacterized protein n=1 Tax=Plectus sambesii TaxID=2011161 RepID=A0A914V1D0_9BILA